ncbi:MAG: TIGR03619 family F420-dependent LLM class oxidoreductase [Chloroflexi bacterium]|nr:TIGR03619 family F420-dependent LLM class oxidoreductase [Chloroflexota bacterium]
MKFGVRLPTWAFWDAPHEKYATISEFARRAEQLGFDGLWAVEHLLTAPGLYGASWLEPMMSLAYAAAVTSRIQLATGILVAPLRHPLFIAKEVATLQALSGGRSALGVGLGWDEREFSSLGIRLKERGGRLDEILEVLPRLLTAAEVTYSGRYYRFDGVTIDPRLPAPPPIWIAGGGKLATSLSPDKTAISLPVLRRIARHGRWMSRSAGDQETVKSDWRTIVRFLEEQGRSASSVTFGHGNWVHLVDARDREEALRRQRPLFERAMGTHRSFEHIQRCYLMGTTAEIVDRIHDLREAGLQYLVVGLLDYDLEQLDRWARDVFPLFAE